VEQQAPATSWGLLCPLVGDQRSDEAARRGRDLLEAQFGAGAYLLHFAVSRLHRCESSASVVPADGVSVRHVMGRRPGPGVRNGGGTPVKRALGFAAVLGEDKRVVGQGGGGYGCGERA
jgi:hypothetical protein